MKLKNAVYFRKWVFFMRSWLAKKKKEKEIFKSGLLPCLRPAGSIRYDLDNTINIATLLRDEKYVSSRRTCYYENLIVPKQRYKNDDEI